MELHPNIQAVVDKLGGNIEVASTLRHGLARNAVSQMDLRDVPFESTMFAERALSHLMQPTTELTPFDAEIRIAAGLAIIASTGHSIVGLGGDA